jgi:hypothetical protein
VKQSFKKAFGIFKYLALAFTVGYCIYIVIDDYNFFVEYWTDNWQDYLTIGSLYLFSYLLAFSVYYWAIAAAVILIYHKLIKKNTVEDL